MKNRILYRIFKTNKNFEFFQKNRFMIRHFSKSLYFLFNILEDKFYMADYNFCYFLRKSNQFPKNCQKTSFGGSKIKLIFKAHISKILPSVIFILSVITLSQYPIIIPDCRLNSRIPRFDWPLYQIDDAKDKNYTRQDIRYRHPVQRGGGQYRRKFFIKLF